MRVVPSDWSERHKALSQIIRKEDRFSETVSLIRNLHRELHTSKVSGLKTENAVDLLFGDLRRGEAAVMPTAKDETISWAVWHIARIEDLTMNLLVDRTPQVFDASWKERLQVSVTDTGNAMTDGEIMSFSRQVRFPELLRYRDAVGKRSRAIIERLKYEDLKRKAMPEDIAEIRKAGGVTEQADSVWLLDFWGKKDVAGLVLMPLTRHQTLHLNDCAIWKERIRKSKKFFAE